MLKIIKFLFVLTAVWALSACSIAKIAEKILPEPVQTHAQKAVDAVMQKDASFFEDMRADGISDAKFKKAFAQIFTQVASGAEVRRDIVSARAQVNASLGAETQRIYEVGYEIKTTDGYSVVNLSYTRHGKETKCCDLTHINVQKYKKSPFHEPMIRVMKIVKYVGLAFLLGLLILIFVLVRWSRRQNPRKPS